VNFRPYHVLSGEGQLPFVKFGCGLNVGFSGRGTKTILWFIAVGGRL